MEYCNPYLKQYIWNTIQNFETKQKKKATKSKGKSIENLMNKFDMKIVADKKKLFEMVIQTNLRSKKQLDNGLIIIKKDKCRNELILEQAY